MHIICLIFILCVVVFVVVQQWKVRSELNLLFEQLKKFLPTQEEDYEYTRGNYLLLEEANPEVVQQLQRYIDANQHIAPNFDIIKDIVERSSNELDERVRTLLSLPLYYGLCGTIFGIIFGLLPLVLDNRQSLNDLSPLILGVILAMVGSLVGIGITAFSHRRYKEVSREHELGKRTFFNWFQVSQLPVLGSNPAGPLGQFIRSLSSFNEDFANSTRLMSGTAEKISQTFEKQSELLELMRNMADPSVAIKNQELAQQMTHHIDVVRSFNNSIVGMQNYVEKLESVTQELQSSTEYLRVVRKLVALLNSSEEAIEKAKSEQIHRIQSFASEQQALSDKTLETMRENAATLTFSFQRSLSQTTDRFQAYLNEHSTVPESLKEVAKLPDSLKLLHSELQKMEENQQDQVTQLLATNERLSQRIAQLEEQVQELRAQNHKTKTPRKEAAPTLSQQPPSSETPPKKGWWSRLKQRFAAQPSPPNHEQEKR